MTRPQPLDMHLHRAASRQRKWSEWWRRNERGLGGVEFNADDLEEAFKAGFTAGIDLGCNCQHDKATP